MYKVSLFTSTFFMFPSAAKRSRMKHVTFALFTITLKAPWNEHDNLTEKNCFQPNKQSHKMLQLNFDSLLTKNTYKVSSLSLSKKWAFTCKKQHFWHWSHDRTWCHYLQIRKTHYYSIKMNIKVQNMWQTCPWIIRT